MSTKPIVNGSKAAKPTAKVAAAKKPPLYVPSPALKLKVGQEIKVRNTRNGNIAVGRFVGREKVPGAAGDWIKFNIAAKGKPAEYKLARAGQVSI